MKLYIGNKNYSSWSMRPWVLMRHFGIAFEEVMLRFDSLQADSEFKRRILALSPAGRVPVLVDGDLVVWDTLAIAETLAEAHPQHAMWPRERAARARARSLCAEMHSGFSALRGAFPMNIEAELHEVGARVLAERPAARDDLARIVSMWSEALRARGGPFLFGDFGIVDAFYAPVASRTRTYALPLPADVDGYVQRLLGTEAVSAWVRDALEEHDFVADDEPYRSAP